MRNFLAPREDPSHPHVDPAIFAAVSAASHAVSLFACCSVLRACASCIARSYCVALCIYCVGVIFQRDMHAARGFALPFPVAARTSARACA